MNKEEAKEQLESLIEAWYLNEADLNQTDIDAIKYILNRNKELQQEKENLIKYLENEIKFINKDDLDIGTLNLKLDDSWMARYNTLKKILKKVKSGKYE